VSATTGIPFPPEMLELAASNVETYAKASKYKLPSYVNEAADQFVVALRRWAEEIKNPPAPTAEALPSTGEEKSGEGPK
jgi:hypothetical protein